MKKNNDSVPRLDLAPQLKRPLSIWNPLDYLRLLYWVFFFPQALRWYVENYGGGEGLAKQTTWKSKLEFLFQHPNQLKLWFQGLILTVCVPYLFCVLLLRTNSMIDWFPVAGGVVGAMVFSMVFDLPGDVAKRVAEAVVLGVVLGVALDMALYIALNFPEGVVRVAAGSAVLGVALGVAGSVEFGVVGGVAPYFSGGMAESVVKTVNTIINASVTFSVIFAITFGVKSGVMSGVALGVVFPVALGLAILRPENWLIGIPLYLISIHNPSFLIPRITPIPLPLLTNQIKFWLRKDWQVALENIDQLLRYSSQSTPVVNAINQVLAELPQRQIVERVAQLAENPYDWKLVMSVSNEVSTGFWHLYKQKPEKATAAFEKVRSLFYIYSEEMFLLAQILTQFQTATSPDAIAEVQIPNFPPEPHLRPTTWEALKGLCRVVEYTQLIVKATSKSARGFPLAIAIGQLKEILDDADKLPQAERGLIVDIAQTWEEALESTATNFGDVYY
ncbi:hypothetical protein [Okeania sp. SIO2C9]|uniref:hypothetical protein n=1 Tax=Okeania sp. SIO2C9 TaxID=2607791 RepID=UPI0025CEF1B9|nr:hypothetical protein [Okeania sp. SIO2C9]